LDNIRRKAPAPRKSNATIDESLPSQRIDLVNTQLVATQHQLQNLQDRYDELANGHVILLQQVVQLQKIVKNHDGAMHRVMGFLHSVDAQRRSSRAAGFANGHGIGIADLVGSGPNDHPASPLQQASQLLGEFSTENLFSKDLEQMQAGFNYRSEFSTPSNDHSSTAAVSQAPTNVAVVANNIPYATTNYDLDSMVYPVGQVNGIDPINSEHIHNIPYAIPPSGPLPLPSDNPADMEQSKSTAADRKKSYTDPGWGMHKPRILLVEDDKTCARVGSKFLQSFQCGVDIAVRISNTTSSTSSTDQT
jgi:osomolarity two-component system response regulator SKN7